MRIWSHCGEAAAADASDTKCGNGWVILSGVHPEAPASWRDGIDFTTPATIDNAYAMTLTCSALERLPLSHF